MYSMFGNLLQILPAKLTLIWRVTPQMDITNVGSVEGVAAAPQYVTPPLSLQRKSSLSRTMGVIILYCFLEVSFETSINTWDAQQQNYSIGIIWDWFKWEFQNGPLWKIPPGWDAVRDSRRDRWRTMEQNCY